MRVLIACEFSGRVRQAFRDRGHDAWSCDLLMADDHSPYHIKGDVTDALTGDWELMIGHPPCTFLANSGVSHLHKDPDRWGQLDKAAEFFRKLLNSGIPKVCIENPIPHKYAVERIGRKYDQIVQPYMFGHLESKATCFWLNGLKPLAPTSDLKRETMALPARKRQRLHFLPPSPTRWKQRSTTYQGIANALAEQYG